VAVLTGEIGDTVCLPSCEIQSRGLPVDKVVELSEGRATQGCDPSADSEAEMAGAAGAALQEQNENDISWRESGKSRGLGRSPHAGYAPSERGDSCSSARSV